MVTGVISARHEGPTPKTANGCENRRTVNGSGETRKAGEPMKDHPQSICKYVFGDIGSIYMVRNRNGRNGDFSCQSFPLVTAEDYGVEKTRVVQYNHINRSIYPKTKIALVAEENFRRLKYDS